MFFLPAESYFEVVVMKTGEEVESNLLYRTQRPAHGRCLGDVALGVLLRCSRVFGIICFQGTSSPTSVGLFSCFLAACC